MSQVQQYIKQSFQCLLCCLHLFRLAVKEIRVLEEPDKRRRKAVAAGKWDQFRCSGPPKLVPAEFGPPLPTAQECSTVPDQKEHATLNTLGKHYVPSISGVAWISGYVAERSSEAPRQTACAFWQNGRLHPSGLNARFLGRTSPSCNKQPEDPGSAIKSIKPVSPNPKP